MHNFPRTIELWCARHRSMQDQPEIGRILRSTFPNAARFSLKHSMFALNGLLQQFSGQASIRLYGKAAGSMLAREVSMKSLVELTTIHST